MSYETAWKDVEEMVADQRLEAAASKVERILREARQAGAEQEWTRALIEGANLRIALHGFEDAVRFLKDESWPAGELHRSLLNLYYAHALTTYVRAYSWEIESRERVDLHGEVDLKKWTKDQILAEADRAFFTVWSRRATWGTAPIGAWGAYLQKNNYPPGIRSTVRDLVTYLWVQMLSNSANWTASELNEVFGLSFEELLEGESEALLVGLESPDRHPLYKMAGLLADLESWHAGKDRPEAAFEARLERLRRLQAAFSESQFVEERRRIRDNLRDHLEALGRSYPWWSMGQSQLAELIRAEEDPNALVEAREVALEGARFHHGSIGSKRCQRLVAEIEAPDYSLVAMRSDGPRRRSIQVSHRNLEALYLRAYRLDVLETLEASRDYNLLPAHREVVELVDNGVPVAQWKVELPATPDFRSHATYVSPPMTAPGLYVIVGSARQDFSEAHNRRLAVNLLITDLVLVSRQRGGALEVTVMAGDDGARQPDVEVALYRFDYKNGHRRVATRATDDDGSTSFRLERQRSDSHFLIARRGEDFFLDARRFWFGGREMPGQVSRSALIYTDRSIYRPLQEVLWKVVGYERNRDGDRFETLPHETVTVDLLDSNGELVETAEVETNEFGTASGAFQVPGGRLLGSWSLRTSFGGWSQVRVEEYKRPTFEVTLLDPEESVRLNRPASLSGEVRYYFGLPVVTGQVDWHVSRVPVFPRWMSWYRSYPTQVAETIASGTV